jgi:broad specificity phosphatase PhoE
MRRRSGPADRYPREATGAPRAMATPTPGSTSSRAKCRTSGSRSERRRAMPEVLLVRHGRPLCDDRTPVRGAEFAAWVQAYDEAPIDVSVTPPARLREMAGSFDCLVTSSLRRARESAHLLTGGRTALSEAVFDEAGIPTAITVSFRLPPPYWDAASRAAWFCGWSGGAESIHAARSRARLGAERLAACSRTHGRVMLVGHGMMNRLLAGELRRAGWKGALPKTAYWGSTLLRTR